MVANESCEIMMSGTFEDFAIEQIEKNLVRMGTNYSHLLVLVAAAGNPPISSISADLKKYDLDYLDVSLMLSARLAQLPHQHRSKDVMPILREIVDRVEGSGIILDNLGILFDRSLSLRPLKILQELAKNRAIVAVWQGQVVGSKLIYAEPNHPEYCCEAIDNSFRVVDSSHEV
jgi:hypothetical protein